MTEKIDKPRQCKLSMDGLGEEEQEYQISSIVDLLKENNGEMPYKEINEILSHKFEGVRLVLKVMKDKEIVDFDGIVPSFSGTIKLVS